MFYLNGKVLFQPTQNKRARVETDKMQSMKVHFLDPIPNQGNEMWRTFQKKEKKVHLTYLDSLLSLLLVMATA